MSSRILFLEDDQLFAQTIVDLLEEESYQVTHLSHAQAVLDATYEQRYDLYLLDINVPYLKGTQLLAELRASNDTTPAIFLTSHSDKESIKEGFASGGDDFISKPFDNDELLWRIAALLKRTTQNMPQSRGRLAHDHQKRLFFYDAKELELSKKEYELLYLFFSYPDTILSKEFIYDTLWSSSQMPSDGALRVYITRLRELLGEESIQNIRSRGYRFVCNT